MKQGMSDLAVCSVHGKKRTVQNLEDDGAGGQKCVAGCECDALTIQGKGGRPGDWLCPFCGENQFARNEECRQCFTPKPDSKGGGKGGWKSGKGDWDPVASSKGAWGSSSDGWSGGGWGGKGGGKGGGGGSDPMAMMMKIMSSMGGGGGGGWGDSGSSWGDSGSSWGSSGSWGGGGKGGGKGEQWGNVVCSLHGKKRSTNNMEDDGEGGMKCATGSECDRAALGKGSGPQPGDWTCPSCADDNFARNTKCRKCAAPNPDGDGGKGARAAPY